VPPSCRSAISCYAFCPSSSHFSLKLSQPFFFHLSLFYKFNNCIKASVHSHTWLCLLLSFPLFLSTIISAPSSPLHLSVSLLNQSAIDNNYNYNITKTQFNSNHSLHPHHSLPCSLIWSTIVCNHSSPTINNKTHDLYNHHGVPRSTRGSLRLPSIPDVQLSANTRLSLLGLSLG
jgi:hypothetical protein